MATDVRRLLLKLGISSTIHRKRFRYRGGHRSGYTVNVLGGRTAYTRFAEVVGPYLVGAKRAALAALLARYDGLPRLLARGSVDVVPVALCREAIREPIAKRFPSLKAGCRALGIAYRLLFADEGKAGIRRDTVAYLAERLEAPALDLLARAPVGWSRPRGFVPDGVEPTYDFEVPGARSFIANGIAVHNSHAAAYGLIAYQTAYLKTNYPVEFMAALLTSEMGDTDKIVQYIEECRAMGIEVEPPDVNVSKVQFSVAGGNVRFGLAAIKNVGEAAMESILKTRDEAGAFASLLDFCTRVDLRLVNRRVIESLVKAGAFDSLGLPRAHLMTRLDAALEQGQRQQRDRAEGQGSFFDLLPASPTAATAAPEGPIVPEWESDERLGYEKEMLGFYISGHPLARYRSLVEALGVTFSRDLPAKGAGSKVQLFGQVATLKEIPTKSGNRMAFVTLEDTEGSVELTVFPEAFKAGSPLLRSREPLLVRGRIDDGDKGRAVLVEDVRLLDQVLGAGTTPPRNGNGPNACRVRVPAEGDVQAALAAVRAACAEHPGSLPLFVHVLLPTLEVVVRARGMGVDAGPDLVAKLEALLGRGAVIVDHGGRA